jgi:hypothetical protein
MGEFRHRYNCYVSELRRIGYPKLGHFDTWLIDLLQRLVEQNHGVLYIPSWSNASDYVATSEVFDTVPLHSDALEAAILAIKIDSPPTLTSDQRYICKVMGTKLPLLPVYGEKECALFNRLMLAAENVDFDQMALDWCIYVDGIDIFPKLPVYLRNHFSSWQHNVRVRDAVKKLDVSLQNLHAINAATLSPLTIDGGHAGQEDLSHHEEIVVRVEHHTSIPSFPADMIPTTEQQMIVIGGTNISLIQNNTTGAPQIKRARGDRGADSKKRKARKCGKCLENKSNFASTCKGRGGREKCEHFQ